MRRAAAALPSCLLLAIGCVKGWTPDQTTTVVRSACTAHPVRAVGSTPSSGNGASPPMCGAAEDGALDLSYKGSTCVEPRPFRGCRIDDMFDVSAFEAGDGVWQAEICVDGPLIDTVNLRWETQGLRRYINLLQPGAAPGCHVVFLAPADACLSFDNCGPLCAGGAKFANLPDAAATPRERGSGGRDRGCGSGRPRRPARVLRVHERLG